jgi:hypothetical protein
MKNKISLAVIFFIAGLACMSTAAFAGTGRVRFGAGSGCMGTGICEIGGTSGATVAFEYYQNIDSAGGSFTKLTMIFNYEAGTTNGFKGNVKGGTYIFTDGYQFNHASDQGLGVPRTYSIPADYAGNYTTDDKGNTVMTISGFVAK